MVAFTMSQTPSDSATVKASKIHQQSVELAAVSVFVSLIVGALQILDPGAMWSYAIVILLILLIVAMYAKVQRHARGALPKLDPTSQEHLFGRSKDIDRMIVLCNKASTIRIIGESGVGKTAFIRAGIFPNASRNRIIPVFIEDWGSSKSFHDNLEMSIAKALTTENIGNQAALGDLRDTSIEKVTARVLEGTGFRLLLIVDDFERYFAHRTKDAVDIDHISLFPEWGSIRTLVEMQLAILLISVDNKSAKHSRWFCVNETEDHKLTRIDLGTDNGELFHDFLTKFYSGQPTAIQRHIINGIVSELVARGPTLPSEIALALKGIQTSWARPYLFFAQGGMRAGRQRVISSTIASCAKKCGVTQSIVVMVLDVLVRSDGKEILPPPLSGPDITKLVGPENADAREVRKIIKHLCGSKIIRESQSSKTYSICSPDYAVSVRRYINQLTRDLEEMHDVHLRQHGIVGWWGTLVPPSSLITIFVNRVRGRIEFGRHRRYISASTMRLVPWLMVPVIAADCNADFWGAATVRDALDTIGVSLSRRVYMISTLQDRRKQIIERIHAESDFGDVFGPHPETWSAGQEIYKYTCAPSYEQDVVQEGLRTLHNNYRQYDTRGRPYGWVREILSDVYIGPSTMWIAAATSRHARLSQAYTSEVVEWLDFSWQASNRLWQGEAWTFYPDQRQLRPHLVNPEQPDVHSTYVTTLGLLYLAEEHARIEQSPQNSDVGLAEVEGKIESAFNWLVSVRTPASAEEGGWRPFPERFDSQISLGLTFQVYATLFIISKQFPQLHVPDEIYELCAADLGAISEGALSDRGNEDSDNNGIYLGPTGELRRSEVVATYPWASWAIIAGYAWIDLREDPPRRDRRRVQRGLSYLVGDEEGLERWLEATGAFAAAELYVGLSDCVGK